MTPKQRDQVKFILEGYHKRHPEVTDLFTSDFIVLRAFEIGLDSMYKATKECNKNPDKIYETLLGNFVDKIV